MRKVQDCTGWGWIYRTYIMSKLLDGFGFVDFVAIAGQISEALWRQPEAQAS
jgi:hypothetical protein